jgi:hypothetical protein
MGTVGATPARIHNLINAVHCVRTDGGESITEQYYFPFWTWHSKTACKLLSCFCNRVPYKKRPRTKSRTYLSWINSIVLTIIRNRRHCPFLGDLMQLLSVCNVCQMASPQRNRANLTTRRYQWLLRRCRQHRHTFVVQQKASCLGSFLLHNTQLCLRYFINYQ